MDIRLIIWDLDETFWKGTLAENDVQIVMDNINLIKNLSKRGIINSICSKNDYNKVKLELETLGIWDYFVFPQISYFPKGKMVKKIVDWSQLRSETVFFIDDNFSNLNEVKFYIEGINIYLPTFITFLKSNINNIGKEDEKCTRLEQYRLLAKKADSKEIFSDNISFLKESEIQIAQVKFKNHHCSRILELINRTNQLNFTKKRIDNREVYSYLEFESFVYSVKDKYGDYGIIGFSSVDKSNNECLQYVFSCRILNMGIEQFVFHDLLNSPNINIVGDVVSDLNYHKNEKIDWITLDNNHDHKNSFTNKNDKLKVLLKGGCDLDGINPILDKSRLLVLSEFNHNHPKTGVPLHTEHSLFVVQLAKREKFIREYEALNIYPFFNMESILSDWFDKTIDVVVYSVLMDYTQGVYMHKETGLEISYGDYDFNLCDPASLEDNLNYYKINESIVRTFQSDFEFLGSIQKNKLYDNLQFLIHKSSTKKIIILLGAEIDISDSEILFNRAKKHKEYNEYLISNLKGSLSKSMHFVKPFQYAKQENDFQDSIRHYKRNVYNKIFQEISFLISENEPKIIRKRLASSIMFLKEIKHRLMKYLNH